MLEVHRRGRVILSSVGLLSPIPTAAPAEQEKDVSADYPVFVQPPMEDSSEKNDGDFPPFPGVAKAVEAFRDRQGKGVCKPVPYVIHPKDVSQVSNMFDPDHDLLCPFVGLTSVGKTSLLKAIFDLDPDDDLLRVRATMDTTLYSSIMLWKVLRLNEADPSSELRVWLMDMRGVHGASTNDDAASAQLTVQKQLDEFRLCAKMACFVAKGNPTDEAKHLFLAICSRVEDRVLVVYNDFSVVYSEEEKRRLISESTDIYNGLLQKELPGKSVEVLRTKVIRCNGATREHLNQEEGIQELIDKLTCWLQMRHKGIEAALKEERDKEKEKRIQERAAKLKCELFKEYFFRLPLAVGVPACFLLLNIFVTFLLSLSFVWDQSSERSRYFLAPVFTCLVLVVAHAVIEWKAQQQARQYEERGADSSPLRVTAAGRAKAI